MNDLREKLNNLDLKTALQLALAYRFIILAVITLTALGFAFLRIQAISNPTLNEQKLSSGMDELQAKAIRFDKDTLDRIESLNTVDVDVEPGNLGKTNPFN